MMNIDLLSSDGKGKFEVAAYHSLPESLFMQMFNQDQLLIPINAAGMTERLKSLNSGEFIDTASRLWTKNFPESIVYYRRISDYVISSLPPDETQDRRVEAFIISHLSILENEKETIIAITNGYVLGQKKIVDTVVNHPLKTTIDLANRGLDQNGQG